MVEGVEVKYFNPHLLTKLTTISYILKYVLSCWTLNQYKFIYIEIYIKQRYNTHKAVNLNCYLQRLTKTP